MQLTSPSFINNGSIPSQYTCDSQNISPPLAWSNIPENTKSLVLIMDDPDVPKSAGVAVWDHWIVFNIPQTTTSVAENEEPPGTHGAGTSGNRTYHGPCPPDREHRYFFKLYALDARLDLLEGASKAEVEKAMGGHVLAEAELVGKYARR